MDTIRIRLQLAGHILISAAVLGIFILTWIATCGLALFLLVFIPESRWPAKERWARYETILRWPGKVWQRTGLWHEKLTDRELDYCASEGIDPVEYARTLD